jgi:protein-S-isoprenylcysteine O-methyltransferase Ste14
LLALWPLGVAGAFLSSRAEEKLLRQEFGTRYDEYAEQRNRFIPGLW